MRKLVSKALTNLMSHLISLPLIDLNHCAIEVVYACIYSLELAEPCYHGERFQHCTCTLYIVDIVLFCLWMSMVRNKERTCKSMEFVFCVRDTLVPLA